MASLPCAHPIGHPFAFDVSVIFLGRRTRPNSRASTRRLKAQTTAALREEHRPSPHLAPLVLLSDILSHLDSSAHIDTSEVVHTALVGFLRQPWPCSRQCPAGGTLGRPSLLRSSLVVSAPTLARTLPHSLPPLLRTPLGLDHRLSLSSGKV